MNIRLKRVILALILLCCNLAPAVAAQRSGEPARKHDGAPPPYSFAVIPFYSPEKIWLLYSPFIEYLTRITGKPWELKLFHDHEEFINALCRGQVTIGLAGPVPLSRAYERCGVTPFLVALDKGGLPVYHSVMLTNDPAVTRLQDLKGRWVGFFKGSTAAHIVPVKLFKDAGVRLSDIRPQFLDSQDRIMTELLSGNIAAAGVKEALYQKFSKGPLHVLKISAPLPNFSFCLTRSTPPAIRQRLHKELLSLKPLTNVRDAEIVKGWDDEIRNGFVEPDKQYMPAVQQLHKLYEDVKND